MGSGRVATGDLDIEKPVRVRRWTDRPYLRAYAYEWEYLKRRPRAGPGWEGGGRGVAGGKYLSKYLASALDASIL